MKNEFVKLAVRAGVVVAALLIGVSSSCKKQVSEQGILREVRIGYFANITHAQAVLGVSTGDFAGAVAPTILKTQVFNAGPSLIEAVLAGEIDIGYVGPGPALNAQARTHGKGIRVIAGAAANGVLIVAREGSGIKTLEDLKGKKLATPQQGNTQDIAARHYLQSVLKQSDLSNVGPIANAEQVGMMSRNQIDAAWAPEPWGSLLVSQAGAKIIAEEKDLWPDKQFTLTVVITTPEFLAAHADVVEKLLKVHRTWTAKLNDNPAQYATQLDAALFGLTNKRFPAGVFPTALARVKFTDQADEKTFQTLGEWSFDLGFDKQKADLTGLFDLSVLRKLEQQGGATPTTTEAGHAGNDPAAK
ncbi:MAG TPA: aliphatic sulfonate ABC transporter substrate-binding protein [Tepidisphaeraceae bacterium]|jgi:NitT/TauT family transport system substrate-binding protein